MNKIMIRGAVLFFLLFVSHNSFALGWIGAYGPCVDGSHSTSSSISMCDWYPNTGAYYGKGQLISSLSSVPV